MARLESPAKVSTLSVRYVVRASWGAPTIADRTGRRRGSVRWTAEHVLTIGADMQRRRTGSYEPLALVLNVVWVGALWVIQREALEAWLVLADVVLSKFEDAVDGGHSSQDKPLADVVLPSS